MSRTKSMYLRVIAVVLAVCMAFSLCVVGIPAFAADDGTQSVSVGEMMASNYDGLSDAEKGVLEGGYLADDVVYSYVAPTDDDNLVSIDSEDGVVTATASTYTDAENMAWAPVSAVLLDANNQEIASDSMTSTADSAAWTFQYDGQNYSVTVTYALSINVNTGVQQNMLDAIAALGNCLNDVNDVLSLQSLLSTMVGYEDTFRELHDLYYNEGITVELDEPQKEAIEFLFDNLVNGEFKLSSMLEAYSAGKTQYLMENGAAFQEEVQGAYVAFSALNKIQWSYVLQAYAYEYPNDVDGYNYIKSMSGDAELGFSTAVLGLEDAGKEDSTTWEILDKLDAFRELSDAEYAALDLLLRNYYGSSSVDLSGTLLAATSTVTSNVARHSVNVTLQANVIEDATNVLVTKTADTFTVTVSDGLDEDGVMEAVLANYMDSLPDAWNAYGVNSTNYTANCAGSAAADNEITDITIVFNPVGLAVAYEGGTSTVPYGYRASLPFSSNCYTLDWASGSSERHLAGKVVTIVESVSITGEAGEWEEMTLNELLAKSEGLSEEVQAVLNALSGTETLVIQVPNESSIESVSKDSGVYVATAYSVDSALGGSNGSILWVPSTATFYNRDGEAVATVSFGSSDGETYTAASTLSSASYAEVKYALDLSAVEGALESANLPVEMASDYIGQSDAMESISDPNGDLVYGLGLVGEYINDIEVAKPNFSENARRVINDLLDEYETYGTFKLLSYLTAYQDYGMGYFYQNYDIIMNELNTIYEELVVVYDDEYQGDREEYLGERTIFYVLDMHYDTTEEALEKMARIENAKNALEEAIATLSELTPSEAIDTSQDLTSLQGLAALVAALAESVENDSVSEKTSLDGVSYTKAFSVDADDQTATLNLVVYARQSDGNTYSESKSETLVPADEDATSVTVYVSDYIEDLESLVPVLESSITSIDTLDNSSIYQKTQSWSGDAITIELGSTSELSIAYDPVAYTVNLTGAAESTEESTQTVYFDLHVSQNITLPVYENAEGEEYAYELTVGNNTIRTSAANNSVNLEDCKVTYSDFVNGSLSFEVSLINLAVQNVLDVVDIINTDLAAQNSMVKTASGGNELYVGVLPYGTEDAVTDLVMRISPENLNKDFLTGLMTGLAYGVKDAGSVLEFSAGGTVKQFYDGQGTVTIQALIDALLCSDFDLIGNIRKAINASGQIVELELDGGEVITDGLHPYVSWNTEDLGGELIALTMYIDGHEVTLHITLESYGISKVLDNLKSVYNLTNTLENYNLDVTLSDGFANVTIPNKAYQLIVAAMLVEGAADISDLNSVTDDAVIDYLWELVEDNDDALEDVTLEQIENTLAELGYNKNLTGNSTVSKLYDYMMRALPNLLSNTTSEDGVLTYAGMEGLMNKLFGSDAELIKSDSELSIPVTINSGAVGKYQVLYLDLKADGLKNKAGLGTVSSVLNQITDNNAILILTQDYEGDIETSKNVYLDLNGHSVTGNVIGANITLIDSSWENSGTISGSVNVGRNYTDNSHGLYTVYENNGTITFLVSPEEVLADDFSVKELAFSVAFDVILHYYTKGCLSMAVEGVADDKAYQVYNVEIEDLIDLYEHHSVSDLVSILQNAVDLSDLSALLTNMLVRCKGFKALSEDNGVLLALDVDSKNWKFTLDSSGNTLALELGGVGDAASQRVVVALDHNDQYYEEAIKLFEGLAEVATVENPRVTISEVSVDGHTVHVEASVNVDEIILDLTGDPNYALAAAIILANGTSSSYAKDRLVEVINAYFAETDSHEKDQILSEIKVLVDMVSTQDLISALKKINRNNGLDEIIDQLGIETGETELSKLYATYRVLFVGVSYVLRNYINTTGSSTALGTYDGDKDGTYVKSDLSKTVSGSKSVSSYTVSYDLSAKVEKLTVKLFDVTSYPIYVTYETSNGTVDAYKGRSLAEAFASVVYDDPAASNWTITVYGEIDNEPNTFEIPGSLTLTDKGSYINAEAYEFILAYPDAELITNVSGVTVTSGVDGKRVDTKDLSNGYTRYYLVGDYTVYAFDADGNQLYKGYSVKDAFDEINKNGGSGSVFIDGQVSMDGCVCVEGSVNLWVTEGSSLNQNGCHITLKNKEAVLTSNQPLSILDENSDELIHSGRDDMYVAETIQELENTERTLYTYSLVFYDVVTYCPSRTKVLYKGDNLSAAFAQAKDDGCTVTVYGSDVRMTENILVQADVTLNLWYGANLWIGGNHFLIADGVEMYSNMDLNRSGYQVVASDDAEGELTITGDDETGVWTYSGSEKKN